LSKVPKRGNVMNDAALRSALWAAACGNWYAWEKYIHEWRTSVPKKGNE